MLAVNEAVGFTPAGVQGAWRKELWADLSGRRAAGGAVLRAAALRGGTLLAFRRRRRLARRSGGPSPALAPVALRASTTDGTSGHGRR